MRICLLLILLSVSASAARAQKPTNAQTEAAIAEWAQEILLGSEFGGDGRICSRWTKSPTLAVIGGTSEHYEVVTDVVADINSVLAKTPIRGIRLKGRGTKSADIRVHFAPMADFDSIAKKEDFRYTRGNRGYFYNKWNAKHEIYDGVVLLATDKFSGGDLKHYTLEEITQVLGPQNDSAAFTDSVFYSGPKGNGRAQKLGFLDQQLLRFFYSHVSPGQNQQQLRSAIRRHWLKNVEFERDSKESTWAQTVLLGSEFGGSGKLCSRWTKSPRLSVFGGTQQHRRVIEDTVAHLNETLAKTPIKRIELIKPNAEGAEIRVYFARLSEFNDLAKRHHFGYPAGNFGYFYTFWNGRHEMRSAIVMLATDRLTGNNLRHYALEEITQSLGLANDSPEFSDSIFFENGSNFGNAISLSSRDQKLLRIFYNHIKPGGRRTDIREAVRKYWNVPVSAASSAASKSMP